MRNYIYKIISLIFVLSPLFLVGAEKFELTGIKNETKSTSPFVLIQDEKFKGNISLNVPRGEYFSLHLISLNQDKKIVDFNQERLEIIPGSPAFLYANYNDADKKQYFLKPRFVKSSKNIKTGINIQSKVGFEMILNNPSAKADPFAVELSVNSSAGIIVSDKDEDKVELFKEPVYLGKKMSDNLTTNYLYFAKSESFRYVLILNSSKSKDQLIKEFPEMSESDTKLAKKLLDIKEK